MKKNYRTKLVREGAYVAEIDIALVAEGRGWSPYLSIADAEKLDAVKTALRSGDVKAASQLARVYKLTPVTAK